MRRSRRLVEPCKIVLDKTGSFDHAIGGPNEISGGACPNCDKPLLLYLSLDMRDPLIGLSLTAARVPLLYCMRCPLCWYEFSYQVLGDYHIEILSVYRESDATVTAKVASEWYANGLSDVFGRRNITLQRMPERIQELHDKLNARERKLTAQEIEELAALTGCYADAAVGGYARYDVINQIGGRSFMQQRVVDPDCPQCTHAGARVKMYFLASLVNDESAELHIAPDDVQILFFLCNRCSTVTVIHVGS